MNHISLHPLCERALLVQTLIYKSYLNAIHTYSTYRVIEASDPIISIESTQNEVLRMRGGWFEGE